MQNGAKYSLKYSWDAQDVRQLDQVFPSCPLLQHQHCHTPPCSLDSKVLNMHTDIRNYYFIPCGSVRYVYHAVKEVVTCQSCFQTKDFSVLLDCKWSAMESMVSGLGNAADNHGWRWAATWMVISNMQAIACFPVPSKSREML